MLGLLAEARALGFLGPGPLESHVASAAAFATAIGTIQGQALDLGSGGGVPGLLLAAQFPEAVWVLVESNRRRSSFLARALAELGWAGRVAVHREAAEQAGHAPSLRHQFSLVTSRSFGPPARAAECGAPFLAVGGRLLVAEPPGAPGERWSPDQLGQLGLTSGAIVVESGATIRTFHQTAPCPPQYARPWRAMLRAPMW